MADLQQLQEISHLIDNMHLYLKKIEKAYAENNAENFNSLKSEILKIQSQISIMTKGDKNKH